MVRTGVIVLLCGVSVCVAKEKYKVSELSEEEDTLRGSRFLTDDQKCDGCVAVSYQYHKTFQTKHKNRPETLGNLPNHVIIEILGKKPFITLRLNLGKLL